MTRTVPLLLASLVLLVATGCPPPGKGPSGPGGRQTRAVEPDACGTINTSKVGKKLYSFLQASAALDQTSRELEGQVLAACQKMARELGVSDQGDTRTVCDRAIAELQANLEVSVSTETRMVTRTTPPVCTTDVDFSASFAASCEATVAADIGVRCDGVCRGECDGTCSTGATGGACGGQCAGRCESGCDGYADIDASVDCKASAEIRATTVTTCTEPKVEVVREEVTVVDDSKFQKAMAAIDAGMPTLLAVGAKAKLVGKALVGWGKALGGLVKSGGELVGELGERGVCVLGQLGAAFAAVAEVQVRVEVSIDVSVQASGAAGASAQ
ncbi:MAG: hypothetical protein R2939_07075 [Kofleriaceae bacterium]